MADPIASRSKFLHEATHLLAITSPSASALIGSARDRFIEEADLQVQAKEWDAHRRETCGACGNLMISGWSCEISSKAQSRKKRCKGKNKHNDTVASNTALIYNCLRCHRNTEQVLQTKPRRQLNKTKNVMTLELRKANNSIKNESEPKPLKTANASSKQRQKARKGGLQAMLEKNKTPPSSQGFDLMDFAM